MPHQVNEDDGESEERKEERDFHITGHAHFFLVCICRADDNGMDGAEQSGIALPFVTRDAMSVIKVDLPEAGSPSITEIACSGIIPSQRY